MKLSIRGARFWVLVLALALVAAACGAGSESTTTAASSGTTATGTDTPTFNSDGVLQPLADGFPNQAITIWVGFPPGHTDEQYAQTMITLAQPFSPVPIVMGNHPSGPRLMYDVFDYMETIPGGTEGYSVVVSAVSALVMRARTVLGPSDPRGLQDLLDGVVDITETNTVVLAVPADSPFQTVDDMIQWAKDNPGKLRISTSTIGSAVHVDAEILAKDKGFTYVAVPNNGVGEAQQTLLGGGAEAVTTIPAQIQPYLESGDMRVIYEWGNTRSSLLPDMQTSSELGDRGIDVTRGLCAYPDTPPSHIAWLEALFLKAAAQPAYQDRLTTYGLGGLLWGHDQAVASLKEVDELTAPIIEELGLAAK